LLVEVVAATLQAVAAAVQVDTVVLFQEKLLGVERRQNHRWN